MSSQNRYCASGSRSILIREQISALTGKKFPEVDEDDPGEEQDTVAGRKASLSERQMMEVGGRVEQVELERVSESEDQLNSFNGSGLAKLSLGQ